MKVFAERLRELRVERYLTQAQLAKEIGVVQSSIVFWENDIKTPSAEAVGVLAKYFGVTSDFLLGLDN